MSISIKRILTDTSLFERNGSVMIPYYQIVILK